MERKAIGTRVLARLAHVPLLALQRILNARRTVDPSIWTIARLAIALGVSVGYLAGTEDEAGRWTEDARAASHTRGRHIYE